MLVQCKFTRLSQSCSGNLDGVSASQGAVLAEALCVMGTAHLRNLKLARTSWSGQVCLEEELQRLESCS